MLLQAEALGSASQQRLALEYEHGVVPVRTNSRGAQESSACAWWHSGGVWNHLGVAEHLRRLRAVQIAQRHRFSRLKSRNGAHERRMSL